MKAEAEAMIVTDDRSPMRGDNVLWIATGLISDEEQRCAMDCDWTNL